MLLGRVQVGLLKHQCPRRDIILKSEIGRFDRLDVLKLAVDEELEGPFSERAGVGLEERR